MTYLDILLLIFMVFAAVGGYRLGFLARGGAWIGLLAGIALSTQLVEPAVGYFNRSDQVVKLFVAISVVAGLAVIGQSIGLMVGDRLSRKLPSRFREADRVGGAVAGVVGVLLIVWLLVPSLGHISGEVARLARNSAIVALVDRAAPPPPASLQELSQQVSDFEFPQVFDDMRAAPDAGIPPGQIPLTESAAGQLVPSTMNIEAIGCGGIQEGSGFVVEPEIVVTNAHVVAGTEQIEILLDDRTRLPAAVIAFDGARDIALLHVDGLQRQPLPLASTNEGAPAAVFGYPGGQDNVRIAPATVSDRRVAVGRDIHGQGVATREILILAAELRPGDSGSAVISSDGAVIGVAFAVAPDRSSTAYALTVNELDAVLAVPRQLTSTGTCL